MGKINEEEIKRDIKRDIKKYSGLEAISTNVGGKELVENIQSRLVSALESLISKYKSGKVEELIPLIAVMDEQLYILRTLTRASKNKDLAIEALKEEEKRIQEETS